MAQVLVDHLRFTEVPRFPDLDEIGHGQLFTLSLSNNTATMTHGLHRFPAKFVPQIPAWALDQLASRSATVLDPFAGSGTTVVELLLRGGHGIAIDIDPLARLITAAKTADLDAAYVRVLLVEIKRRFTGDRPFGGGAPMAGVVNFYHWFTKQNAQELAELLDLVMSLRCDEAARRFLLACFSATIRWVSNADDQTQKTYVSGTLPKNPPPAFATFTRAASRACEGLATLNTKRSPHARLTIDAPVDSVALPLSDKSVDLVVTSPPYIDSVDYMYNFMLEYFWLGPYLGLPDRHSFNAARRRYLGHRAPAEPAPQMAAWESRLEQIHGLSNQRRSRLAGYLAGMDSHFAEAARCLRDGGHYVLVAGNSQTLQSVLPIHDALLTLAASHGLVLLKAFGYRVRRHYMKFPRAGRGGIILIDWVMILRKGSRKARSPRPLPLPWVTLHPEAVAN